MKVYVITGAKIFGAEVYLGVKKSLKDAERYLREFYPYMRKTGPNNDKSIATVYYADSNKDMLLFIHEEDL